MALPIDEYLDRVEDRAKEQKRPASELLLLLLRVLVLAALGILHARTYLGHHHRRISLSARAVQQRQVVARRRLLVERRLLRHRKHDLPSAHPVPTDG